MNKLLKSVLQIGFFVLVSLAMNQLVVLMHWPIPGSILGIVVIFIGLQTKLIKLEWIDAGASWLLAEMLLFFIPPAVSLIQYEDLIMSSGLRILLVMLVSSIAVMAGAGFLAQWMVKDKRRNP
ncbi:CidA/LrgA family holin-like protein [Paenibacillus periandrae]|uniref:CidA/LrgA family holin-like protein n=1 Tax=Paenibacillus periandrae TaxID=1761741 RepID=UPI001F089D01|nr:CidA/LrgA family holin-like protein [Paenibacillus periandrae]